MSWISQQVLVSGELLRVRAGPCHPPCMSSQCPRSLSNGENASMETGMGVLVEACKNIAAWGVVELLRWEGSRFLCDP